MVSWKSVQRIKGRFIRNIDHDLYYGDTTTLLTSRSRTHASCECKIKALLKGFPTQNRFGFSSIYISEKKSWPDCENNEIACELNWVSEKLDFDAKDLNANGWWLSCAVW